MYADLNREAEVKRVKEVSQIIAAEQTSNQTKLQNAQHETHQIELNYGDAAKVNTIEVDDRMETNAAIQQQKQLVSLAVENQTILEKRQQRLERLAKSPYFGRIDIDDGFEQETLYIGTATLMDAQDEDFLIYDWRSPIAGIYYNGTLGSVSYQAPAGRQEVKLAHKRQFTIQNDQITNMFDTNETVGDEILQGVLGEAATLYMQNIVATIQREQNDIIRNTSADVLIVQGVAGSGKTSTILQRLAYLLYHSRQKLAAEQVIMFSPNHLFSNYISQVLPSLGEKNMRQVTLSEFFSQRCHHLQVEDKFSRYEHDQQQLPEIAQKMRQFLEAGNILQLVRTYLKQPDFQLKFNDLLLNGETIISQADCVKVYQTLPSQMAWSDKFQQTKNRLIRKLQRLVRHEAQADWVQERVDTLSDYEYQTLLDQQRFDNDEAERLFLGKKIAQLHFEPIYDALYNDYFLDIDQQYLDFLTKNAPTTVAANYWQTRIEHVQAHFERHQLQLSDCAPYLYLRDQLTGGGENHQIQYLFIDEMQDYSPAQLAYLHASFPLAKLTLLGDQAQDLFASSVGLDHFDEEIAALFPHKKVKLYHLNNSYRSTQQITHFASALLLDQQEILAFNRPGPKPQLIICQRLAELNQQVSQQCQRLLTTQSMVAVLTKTEVEAEQIYATLQSDAPVTLMTEKQHHLENGIMIMPIYLAKGLEFDAVIGYNVSAELFQTTTDAHILYTIASRAMHELVLISLGQPTKLITDLDPQLYQK